jgi:hypothetical protein
VAETQSARPVLVLGMHRSGTSALIQLLSDLGVAIDSAEDLLRPNEFNIGGHFEPKDVVQCNNELLRQAAYSWAGPPVHHPVDWCIPPELLARMKACVERRRAKWSSWIWKDPRFCITLPAWRPILGDPICLIIWRHPREVADSLYNRNKFPIGASTVLWEVYCRASIANTEDLPRLLCSFDDLLAEPKPNIARVREFLSGCGLPIPTETESFQHSLDSSLRHHVVTAREADRALSTSQQKLLDSFRAGRIPPLDFDIDLVSPEVVSELLTLSISGPPIPASGLTWLFIRIMRRVKGWFRSR